MTDLTRYNAASLEAICIITDLMPASQRAIVETMLQQGFRLKLSTIVGQSPDVVLTLVNDLEQETMLYSLVGRAGETLQ
jgi:hypothetical protein